MNKLRREEKEFERKIKCSGRKIENNVCVNGESFMTGSMSVNGQ